MEKEFEVHGRGEYRTQGIFLVYSSPEFDVGWKLHVVKLRGLSVEHPHLPQDYLEFLAYLCTEGIPHKLARNHLSGIGAMEKVETQIGKFITIYPADTAQLKILPIMIDLLVPAELAGSPNAPGDRPVSSQGLTSARWGGLTGKNAVDSRGLVVPDNRHAARPDWVQDPFDPASKGVDAWHKFPGPEDEDQSGWEEVHL